MTKKATQEEVERLGVEVHELRVMLYGVAQAARIVPIQVPEQKPYTKWVHADSDEAKTEIERNRARHNTLRIMMEAQQRQMAHGPLGITHE